MLTCTVFACRDNGGPLDHANNYPHRGGKHGFYEGGVRTQAFLWYANVISANKRDRSLRQNDLCRHLMAWLHRLRQFVCDNRWSKLPKAAVGSKYDGLAHIADWRATYVTGVAGITAATIASLEQAPFQDESKNHWAGVNTLR